MSSTSTTTPRRISRRVLIIGEAPGRVDTGRTPLWGSSPVHAGWRLREIVGLSRPEWQRVRRVNLLPVLPDGGWDAALAEHTAASWCHAMLMGQRVILCGQRVRRAFGVGRGVPHATWIDQRHYELASIPHPSGRCLYYNDPENRRIVGDFLRAALVS